ncbi:MAG: hypothetical protein KC502_18320 [Myxococcales bacterium]|nr:hypothetical protein [Myxococcales bacterium]
MTIVTLSGASLLVVLATWIVYFAKVPSGNVPARPVGSILAQFAGIALAVAAVVVGQPSGAAAWGAMVPAAFGLLMALVFLWLLTQRKTPIGDLKVAVGDTLLSFAATSSDGAAFHTDDLLGKRTLLKFFRGGW